MVQVDEEEDAIGWGACCRDDDAILVRQWVGLNKPMIISAAVFQRRRKGVG
jgi:hypothetical protein